MLALLFMHIPNNLTKIDGKIINRLSLNFPNQYVFANDHHYLIVAFETPANARSPSPWDTIGVVVNTDNSHKSRFLEIYKVGAKLILTQRPFCNIRWLLVPTVPPNPSYLLQNSHTGKLRP